MKPGEFISLKDERDTNNNLVKVRVMFFLPQEDAGLGIMERTTYDEHGVLLFFQTINFKGKRLEELAENGGAVYVLVDDVSKQEKNKEKKKTVKEKAPESKPAKVAKKKLK